MLKPLTQKIKPGFLFLILITLLNIAVIALFHDSPTQLVLSDVLYLILDITVIFFLWQAANSTKTAPPHQAAAWRLLLISHLFNVIADILWVYYELILKSDPFPSLADFFYIGRYPLFLIGILLLVEKGSSRARQINTWLDAILVFASSFLFLWVLLFHPLLQDMATEPQLNQTLNIAYPIGDLLLIIALLVLIYKKSTEEPLSTAYLLLAASLLVEIVCDLVFSYQSISNDYISGGWTDIGWVFGYALLASAAYFLVTENPVARKRSAKPLIQNSSWHKALHSTRDLLPYLLAIAALLFAQISYASGFYTAPPFLLVSAWVIALLVFIRQYLALRENNQLNNHLQTALADVHAKAAAEKQMNIRLVKEIRQRKTLQKQLQQLALHDPLTGLPNRTLLLDRLEHVLAYSKRNPSYSFAVFFIDLNNFKQVNDFFGHSKGDEALARLGQHLKTALRDSDTLARLGGDEFALLIEDSPTDESLQQVANRIFKSARMTFRKGGKTITISASIGLVKNGRDYRNAMAILDDADAAMYQSKISKRENVTIYKPGLCRSE